MVSAFNEEVVRLKAEGYNVDTLQIDQMNAYNRALPYKRKIHCSFTDQ